MTLPDSRTGESPMHAAGASRAGIDVALLQFSAGREPRSNLERLEDWLARAPAADLLALPEVVTVRGSDADLRAAAEPLTGPAIVFFSDWARRLATWIVVGSVLERSGGDIYNTAVLLDRRGRIAATYRKMHLFEARLPDRRVIRERDVYREGDRPVMADIEGWPTGLSICYDVRFPELYRTYAARGARCLMIPANFTQHTGRDHWEILVCARAIENQCFVIAPNQCGVNPATGIASYGHSLVVGPWGEVLARAGEQEQWMRATLSYADLQAVRRRVPALDHRRVRVG